MACYTLGGKILNLSPIGARVPGGYDMKAGLTHAWVALALARWRWWVSRHPLGFRPLGGAGGGEGPEDPRHPIEDGSEQGKKVAQYCASCNGAMGRAMAWLLPPSVPSRRTGHPRRCRHDFMTGRSSGRSARPGGHVPSWKHLPESDRWRSFGTSARSQASKGESIASEDSARSALPLTRPSFPAPVRPRRSKILLGLLRRRRLPGGLSPSGCRETTTARRAELQRHPCVRQARLHVVSSRHPAPRLVRRFQNFPPSV